MSVFNTLSTNKDEWPAKIVLSEGAIDPNTQQLNVVAEISAEASSTMQRPLQLNQYVDAVIHGKTLENVFVIPSDYLYQDRYVYVLDDASRIQRREVSVVWQSDASAVIGTGLMEGEELITSIVTEGVLGETATVNQRILIGIDDDQLSQTLTPLSTAPTQDTPTVSGLVKQEVVEP